MQVKCDYCNKDFKRPLWIFKRSKNHFCSHKCCLSFQAEQWERGFSVRFWKRVIKTDTKNDCWLWHKPTPRGTYPMVNCRSMSPFPLPIHRVAYCLTYGEPKDGLYVLHKCNNKRCCNPSHLYAGTAKQNADDCKKAGHMKVPEVKRGEENPKAKLTREKVLEIRSVFSSIPFRKKEETARRYGISAVHLDRVGKLLVWKHI